MFDIKLDFSKILAVISIAYIPTVICNLLYSAVLNIFNSIAPLFSQISTVLFILIVFKGILGKEEADEAKKYKCIVSSFVIIYLVQLVLTMILFSV